MPTKEQLYSRWASELNNPWLRAEDDPMYVSPEKFSKISNASRTGDLQRVAENRNPESSAATLHKQAKN